MYDVENGESGDDGDKSIRFTSHKSDVGREIISHVTFSIGLVHESRPKNSVCRKFGRGSGRVYSKTVKSRTPRRRRRRWRASTYI